MSIILNIGKKSGIGSVSNLVPKSLDSFAYSKGLRVEVLKYKFNGKTFKGYSLVDSKNNEIVEIEPRQVEYDKDKWIVAIRRGASDGYVSTIIYAKSIEDAIKKMKNKDISPRRTGYKFSK